MVVAAFNVCIWIELPFPKTDNRSDCVREEVESFKQGDLETTLNLLCPFFSNKLSTYSLREWMVVADMYGLYEKTTRLSGFLVLLDTIFYRDNGAVLGVCFFQNLF